MLRFYRFIDKSFEYCFNVETSEKLTDSELKKLSWLIAETFEPGNFSCNSMLKSRGSSGTGGLAGSMRCIKPKENALLQDEDNKFPALVEIGPRLNFETAYSTNAVAICHSCGIDKVQRFERSRRYILSPGTDRPGFIALNHDRMTEFVYPEPIKTFKTGIIPEEACEIDLLQKGVKALKDINIEYGLGFDEWDLGFYYNLFVKDFGRNPTNVECFQLSQANSEHSRHWFFKGRLIIDGVDTGKDLFSLIKSPLKSNPANSIIAFKDNSSAILGHDIATIIPASPGRCSAFKKTGCRYHIIFTAETHNFPSGVAPFPGAETGTGGRIRDVQGTGRGGLVIAGTAGYATGNLNMPGHAIPGEDRGFVYPDNLASPLKIMIEESNGASDYGNKFGEPVIQGFTRTFGQALENGERKEWIKPIMFTGGVGQIDDRHIEKKIPEDGMLIIQAGGPAYRIGLGGGSASSLIQGENRQDLDFNAVQRGNAEMEQKLNRVIRACIEMGDDNPILSIHDQGAGGPCNVLTEIVDPAGGKIKIRNIAVGDSTMSVLEIWVAEYQERDAFLIYPEKLNLLLNICMREKVNCEVLGCISGDGKITVYDSSNGSTPVDLELSKILGNIPQKTFHLERLVKKAGALVIPDNYKIETALEEVFKLPSVGSKGYLVRKVDRSVTGLVARQQCCGPLQLPVSDTAVVAQSHFGFTGAALSIGEQPLKIMVNPAAGARMAAAEAITNILWAKIEDISSIKCSVNWMWPAKLPGEGADLWDCACALVGIMKELGIAADGGKDSVSMAAQVGNQTVKSPGQVVVSAYAAVPDINKVITPDIKSPADSRLIFIDLSPGENRLGGSALAQVLNQTGDRVPDIEDTEMLKNAFRAIQELIDRGLILSGHDRSDGGLITTVAEMIMSGNCGAEIDISFIGTEIKRGYGNTKNKENKDSKKNNAGHAGFAINDINKKRIQTLFSEEAGLVIECRIPDEDKIIRVLDGFNLAHAVIGNTLREKKLVIKDEGFDAAEIGLEKLLCWWESTSDALEKHQMDAGYAARQSLRHSRKNPPYRLSFKPEVTPDSIINRVGKPRVAIIREEGSNGDREMTSAFFMAGFEPWDVTMTDLLTGQANLEDFRGAVFVGGFSYADVLDSAKGWAGIIRFNKNLAKSFEDFYNRNDTFSLGVCNGCQLMTLLGWVPWRGIDERKQPRFISNPSGRFESRWVTVKVLDSPSIMLKNMQGSVLGIWVAHREGHLYIPDGSILKKAEASGLLPLAFTDDCGNLTEEYPFNPNSSPGGYTSLCSPDGRHLAMMPHPERAFLLWQWPWLPDVFAKEMKSSPWLTMFQNAREWCEENK